ncbi:MAG: ribonucleotide reductase N-terminal alpha domain-containing protein [Trueperaceae bacterium]|nr:ribonucleotide reductase N-terminal alpha domain-containing protein [Trueperaceae bacterium]
MADTPQHDADPRLDAFDPHAITIARRQYFQPGDEDLAGMFRRVAAWIAGPEQDREAWTETFYDLMADKRFCPGGRVLAGAATHHGNVLNCFVQDGRPADAGTDAWVLSLATKLALVTKVGGGNGLCLDPITPGRDYEGPQGTLYLTISPDHEDYDKVRDGTFMDLVHGSYVTRGYRSARFVSSSEAPAGLEAQPVGDSVDEIWKAAGDAAMAMLDGRDVLLDLSGLRAEGTPVEGSGGTSSGPSSFAVEVFDNFATWAALGGAAHAGPVATLRYVFAPTLRAIRQGGTRRGAGMATLSITHPDVRDFVTSKDLGREEAEGDISTFNISVLVSDAFMASARRDGPGKATLKDIAEHAWATGEPGLIYVDRINEHNPMRAAYGDIKSTNPCVTADTWVDTDRGARRVGDLVDRPFCAVIDGQAYPLRSEGFFSTGVKPVVRLRTRRGFTLRSTEDHRLARVVSAGAARTTEWTEVRDLRPGDRVRLGDQRGVRPWSGPGSDGEGWLLGLLAAAGTFTVGEDGVADLELRGTDREALAAQAEAVVRELRHPFPRLQRRDEDGAVRLASRALGDLARRYGVAPGGVTRGDAVEEGSYAFTTGFLRGVFDAAAHGAGTSLALAFTGEILPARVHRMLARLGVIASLRPGAEPAARNARTVLTVTGADLASFRARIGAAVAPAQARLAALPGPAAETEAETEAEDADAVGRFADVVEAIEPDGEAEVFDVSVDHVHAFTANGIHAHNCGEIPLYAGEPCDLGAMNLSAYVTNPMRGLDGFDTERFREDAASCVRFLDNVLEVNRFALEDNREMSMKLRRLGLGVMGMADALIKMGYAYHSEQGRAAVHAMISELRDAAVTASERLAEERGAFPAYPDSELTRERRNVAVLTVAPTGTTSMLMGVSSGVEPVFAPFIYRKIGDAYAALVHPLFQELLNRHAPHPAFEKDGGWDWEAVVEQVQDNHGSVQGLDFVPDEVKSVLICAHDIRASDHVEMQGVVQRAFDGGEGKAANSISKTINLKNQASVEDVFDAYALAFDERCKGITVYRDGSRQFQVLSTRAAKKSSDATQDGGPATDAPADVPDAPAAATGGAGTSGAAPAAPPTVPVEPPAPRRAAPARGDRLPGEPLFDRPVRLEGFTDAVKLTLSGGEKRGFYVTVNKQDGLPSEVFILSGKAGDEANADSEALGRVVSIALQYGVPAEAVVKTLRGINGGMYGSYQGRMVASKADLIAIALETAGTANPLQKDRGCPECGMPLRFEEGCMKCESCGYSKCG